MDYYVNIFLIRTPKYYSANMFDMNVFILLLSHW